MKKILASIVLIALLGAITTNSAAQNQQQSISTGKTFQSEMNDFFSQLTNWHTSQIPNLMKRAPFSNNLTYQHFNDKATPNAIEMGEIDKLITEIKISSATYAEITLKYVSNLEVRDALIENYNNAVDQSIGIATQLKDGKINYGQYNVAGRNITTAFSSRLVQIERRAMALSEEVESQDPGVNGKKLPQCKRGNRDMCFDVNKVRWGDDFYVGQWKNNRPEGHGTLSEWRPEVIYVGNFSNGRKEGNGTLNYPDGRKYIGTFRGNLFEGAAQFVTTYGTTFIGEFRFGRPIGNGILIDKDGNEYRGDILHSMGSDYTVDIQSFTKQGQGLMLFTNGEKYEGGFVNNKFDGRGVLTHADGTKSIGLFEDDSLFEGTGLLKDKDFVYVGEIKNFDASGQGMITTSDGTKYVGSFLNGSPSGHGTATYANGNKYVGQFVNGEFHGQGTLTLANGSIQSGVFRDGQYITPKQIATEKKQAAELEETERRRAEAQAKEHAKSREILEIISKNLWADTSSGGCRDVLKHTYNFNEGQLMYSQGRLTDSSRKNRQKSEDDFDFSIGGNAFRYYRIVYAEGNGALEFATKNPRTVVSESVDTVRLINSNKVEVTREFLQQLDVIKLFRANPVVEYKKVDPPWKISYVKCEASPK